MKEPIFTAYMIKNGKYDNIEILGTKIYERAIQTLEVIGAKVIEIKSEAEIPNKGVGLVIDSICIFKKGELLNILENNCDKSFKIGEVAYFGNLAKRKQVTEKIEISEQKFFLITTTRAITQLYEYLIMLNIEKHFDNGVIILSPKTTIIEDNVRIAPGVILHGNIELRGDTTIQSGSVIQEGTNLLNATIGHNVVLKNAKIQDSEVDDDASVGPFAFIRNHAKIGKRCRLGDYVEVKNSILGDDVKMAHLAYVGDGEVGARTNIGCGSIFVNYNGRIKQKTIVGEDCFIGSNVNLIAPLQIGSKVYIAAGSTVTKNLKDNEFCVAREREYIKDDWERK